MMEVLSLLSALDSWSLDTRCDGPRLVGVDLHCKERRMRMEERWKFRATRTTRVAGGKGAAAALGERGRTHGWESCEI